jgi:hypothetical protein
MYISSPGRAPLWLTAPSVLVSLTPKAQVFVLAQIQQAAQHRAGLIEFEIMFKRGFLDDQVVKATGVENFAYPLETQQRGVELDEGVDRLFFQHVAADRFDLVGRAAVHGRQRDTLDQPREMRAGRLCSCALRLCRPRSAMKAVIVDPFFKNALVLGELRMRCCIDHAVDEGSASALA